MATELLDLEVPTRAPGDNSNRIASTGYADAAVAHLASVAATEFSGTKTQTTVAATDVATITLVSAIDGASGTVKVTVLSDDGTEAVMFIMNRSYSIVKSVSGTLVAISAAGTQADIVKASASGTFSPTTSTLTATVSGAVATFTVTTANTTGTQAHATIKVTFRDYTGKTVTIL